MEEVISVAETNGFYIHQIEPMPANNYSLIFIPNESKIPTYDVFDFCWIVLYWLRMDTKAITKCFHWIAVGPFNDALFVMDLLWRYFLGHLYILHRWSATIWIGLFVLFSTAHINQISISKHHIDKIQILILSGCSFIYGLLATPCMVSRHLTYHLTLPSYGQ